MSVQLISMPILRFIIQAHGLRFDGHASFTLNIHIVQDLFLYLSIGQG